MSLWNPALLLLLVSWPKSSDGQFTSSSSPVLSELLRELVDRGVLGRDLILISGEGEDGLDQSLHSRGVAHTRASTAADVDAIDRSTDCLDMEKRRGRRDRRSPSTFLVVASEGDVGGDVGDGLVSLSARHFSSSALDCGDVVEPGHLSEENAFIFLYGGTTENASAPTFFPSLPAMAHGRAVALTPLKERRLAITRLPRWDGDPALSARRTKVWTPGEPVDLFGEERDRDSMRGVALRIGNIPYDNYVTASLDPTPRSPRHLYLNRQRRAQ